MPNYIALDWESHQLSGLDAEVTPKSIAVNHVFQWAWPEGLDASSQPEQVGEWLKRALADQQISTKKVVVSLPRADVVVRQLDLPNVPPEELPDLVRLQAETKTSSDLDEMVLDYISLPHSADATLHPVLLATIDRRRVEAIDEVMKSAGLELDSIGISPVATAELVAHLEVQRDLSSDNTTLLVARHAQRVEISFIRSQHLIFTHSTLLDEHDLHNANFSVMAEIRRSLGAVARVDSQIVLARAWIIGMTEADGFRTVFSENFDCDVQVLDPLLDSPIEIRHRGLSSHTAPYAGPVGMLLAKQSQTVPAVDFLNPHKAEPKVDRRRLKIGAAAGCVAAIALIAFGMSRWQVAQLNAQIRDRRTELTRYDKSIRTGQPTVDAAETIHEWADRDIDWLGQMHDIFSEFPETSELYLAEYQCLPASGTFLGRVEAKGFARDRRQVELLYQRLAAAGYRVLPHEISRKSEDPDYPYSFQLEIAMTAETLRGPAESTAPQTAKPDLASSSDARPSIGK